MRRACAGSLLCLHLLTEANGFTAYPKAGAFLKKYHGTVNRVSQTVCKQMSITADFGTPFKKKSPADVFADLASFAQDTSAGFDSYGRGETLQGFEAECAQLLGKEAACFFLTGTQAQNAAIQAHQIPTKAVALHPTSHIIHHNCLLNGPDQQAEIEPLSKRHLPAGQSYVLFGRMDAAPTLDEIVTAIKDDAVELLVLELPQRMNGGAVVSWSDLLKVREAATLHGVGLHMDGARLWEVQPYFGRPLAEICALFDSVYVSFYKGVGAMSGAMLLGSHDLILRARQIQGEMGGRANTFAPFALHCQLQLRRNLPDFQRRFERMRHVIALLSDPELRIVNEIARFDPPEPQSAMVHVYVRGESKEELEAAHEAAAAQSGVRLWSFLRGAGHAGGEEGGEFYFEWLMGRDNAECSDESLLAGWRAFREQRLGGRQRPA